MKKRLKNINPNSISKLWDSLAFSCEEIVKFTKDNQEKELFNNEILRILFISNNVNLSSSSKVENIYGESYLSAPLFQ